MGTIFDDIHSTPDCELECRMHGLEDTTEVSVLRDASGYSGRMALGQALCRQLRYRDAIDVYSEAIAINPSDPEAYRQRAARYIATLQSEKAIADLEFCLPLSMDRSDVLYRMGIAQYLAGLYSESMESEAEAFYGFGAEMGIACMFWHTMSAYRSGAVPELLREYRDDMDVGHHTAYKFAMRLAAGVSGLKDALTVLETEPSDLEYSMMAYGTAVYANHIGENEIGQALLKSIVQRDGFWISYGYLAAWRDTKHDLGRM